ncbi:hypothetical protein GGR51DRAFT_543458 [Nemania sp. FL0031]|nr:hypothetical protein GGR51DRAFT_543458 [Nemania sp. FL0031]
MMTITPDDAIGVAHPVRCGSLAPAAVRIVLKCRSDHIPGEPQHRLTTAGDLICQHLWGRDMNTEVDFIRTNGFPAVDGEKVGFLLDTGIVPPDTKYRDLPILVYRWTGKSMKTQQLTKNIREYIQGLPFKRQGPTPPAGPGKTLSELRDEMDENEWNELMEHAVSQKIRYRRNISRTEREWLECHDQAFDRIMQHHISRREWNHWKLWESQVLWLDAHREGTRTSDLTLMHRILEQHETEIKARPS